MIEPVTTDCGAETLQLSHQFISHASDAKSTSISWSLVRSPVVEITVYTADET